MTHLAGRSVAAPPLIGVERLRELVDAAAAVTILDVRWSLTGPPGRELYNAGHLPGAHFVDLDTELATPPAPDGAGGRHPLPGADQFAAAMRTHGVSRHVPVVVYDQRDGTSAARAWWLLRHYGHQDVRVLDGGFEAWAASGAVVAHEPATPVIGDFVASRGGGLPVLEAEAAAEVARAGVLLDARAYERYAGRSEPVDPVAGHIPGAVAAPTVDNVGADGRFRPPGELRRRFADLGVRDGVPIAVYCGSGITAAHEVLALSVLGVEAALYAGSWSDWISDPSRPVAAVEDS